MDNEEVKWMMKMVEEILLKVFVQPYNVNKVLCNLILLEQNKKSYIYKMSENTH